MADEEKAVLMEDQQAELEVRLREKLQTEYDTRLESEVLKISQRMQTENQRIVADALERYKKEMLPPTEQDVQKLLSQEYVEFKIDIRVPVKNGPGEDSDSKWTKKTFTIQELPQNIEKKIYKKIKGVLVPFSTELAALTFNMLEGDAAKKIVQMMNTFEPLLDVMAGITAICLNPYGEEEEITEEWVQEHLSSTKIVTIVWAQVEANRMRDFFSLLFQGSKLVPR